MSLNLKNFYIKSLFLLQVYCKQVYLPDNGDKRHLSVPSENIYRKGSYTVEAAVCMPVFLCLVVFVLLYFKILTLQWGVDVSIFEVARESAIYSQSGESEAESIGIINSATLVAGSLGMMESNNIPYSHIKFGRAGISFSDTEANEKDIDIRVGYRISMPTVMFGRNSWNIIQRKRARRWVGYDPNEESEELLNVYVTETGSAYHSTVGCVYLNPSVHAVSAAGIEELRSKDGGKYKACKVCAKAHGGHLYVTDYGEVYHSSITCSGIKRSIRRVDVDTAKSNGYHACSKCGR